MRSRMSHFVGWIFLIALAEGSPAQAPADSALLSDLGNHRYAEAVSLANHDLQRRPGDPWLLTMRGLALDAMGKTGEGLASYQEALRTKPDYLPALKGAAQLTYRQHDARASLYLQRLLAIDPKESAAHAMMGVLEFERHDCHAAIRQFQASGDVVLTREVSATEYASCLMREQQTGTAVEALHRARSYFPQSRTLRYDLGLAQMQNGDTPGALATLAPEPDDDAGLLNLRASVEARTGDLNAAFFDLRHAVEMEPRDPRNYVDMALLCLDHDQYQRAADVMSTGIQYLPQNASFYAIRGIAYAELSRYDEAEKDFSRSAALDPKSAFGQLAHNILNVERSQPEQAKATLEKQVRDRPSDAVTNTLLADLLLQQGATPGQPEWDEAKAAVSRALRTRPDSVDALNLQGQIELEEGRLEAAAGTLEHARRLNPDNPATLNRLLTIDKRLGREQDAREVAGHLKAMLNEQAQREQAAMRTTAER